PAGRLRHAAAFDGHRSLDAGDVGHFGFYDKFSFAAWVYPDGAAGGTLLSRMVDVPRGAGYQLALTGGKVQLNLVVRWLDDALRVETARVLEPARWHHVVATYDGSRVAGGVRIYVDGRPEKLAILLDDLNQTFETRQPFRIGAGGGPGGRFHGCIGEVRAYNRALSAEEAAILATSEAIPVLAALPSAKRTPA